MSRYSQPAGRAKERLDVLALDPKMPDVYSSEDDFRTPAESTGGEDAESDDSARAVIHTITTRRKLTARRRLIDDDIETKTQGTQYDYRDFETPVDKHDILKGIICL